MGNAISKFGRKKKKEKAKSIGGSNYMSDPIDSNSKIVEEIENEMMHSNYDDINSFKE